MKSKRVKMMAVALAVVLGISSNSLIGSAATVSQSGYTSGGSAGKTYAALDFSCNANYNTSVDACLIDLSVTTGNIIGMSYENVTSTSKAGQTVISSASGATSSSVNSKTWVIGTGSAGTMYSSQVKKVVASSSEFGTKTFTDVFTTY